MGASITGVIERQRTRGVASSGSFMVWSCRSGRVGRSGAVGTAVAYADVMPAEFVGGVIAGGARFVASVGTSVSCKVEYIAGTGLPVAPGYVPGASQALLQSVSGFCPICLCSRAHPVRYRNHWEPWPVPTRFRRRYALSRKDDLDNHANQMNPNNDAYWESRGFDGRPDDWEDRIEDDDDQPERSYKETPTPR